MNHISNFIVKLQSILNKCKTQT